MPHDALLDRVWGAEYGHTPDHLKVFISRTPLEDRAHRAPPTTSRPSGVSATPSSTQTIGVRTRRHVLSARLDAAMTVA